MSDKNSTTNLTHDRYVSVVSPLGAKVDASSIQAPRKPRRKASVWVSRMMSTMVIMMVAMLGVVQQSSTAEAGFWDPIKDFICGTREFSMVPEKHDAGLRALGIGDPFLQSLGYEDKGRSEDFTAYRHTAYEKYGMSGTNYTAYYGINGDIPSGRAASTDPDPRNELWQCFPLDRTFPNEVSNVLLDITKSLTSATIWIYGQALNPGWADELMDGAALIITGDENITGLRDGLYFNMLGLVVMSSAIYLMFLLFKRQFINVWTNFLWLAGASAVGAALMYQPQFLPNFGQAIVTEFTTAIHNTTTNAVLGKVSSERDNNFCFVGNDVPEKKGVKVNADTMKNVRAMECSIWSVFVYSPWVAGQFGMSSSEVSTLVDKDAYPVNMGKGKPIAGNIALAQIDAQSIDAYDVTRKDDNGKTIDMRNTDINTWKKIADEVLLEQPQIRDSWAGSSGLNRISVASTAIVASIFGLIIVLVLSMSLLMYKVGIILLVALSPFFLLIGAHAGFGRGITLKWASMLAGMYLKTAFTSLFLGITMMFYAIITQLQASNKMDYGVAMLAIIVISMGMLFYRKPLIDTFADVNISGSRGSIGLETPSGANRAGSMAKGAFVGAGIGALGAMGAAKVSAKAAKANVAAEATARAAADPSKKLSPQALAARQRAASGAARTKTLFAGAGRGVVSRSAGLEGLADLKMGSMAGKEVAGAYTRRTAEANTATSAAMDASDPSLIARRARGEQTNAEKYAADYSSMNGDEEWRKGFNSTYGIEPPDPKEMDFPGYGKRFDRETPEGLAEWEKFKPRPRPQTPPPSVGTPGGGKPGGGKPGGSPRPANAPIPTPSGGIPGGAPATPPAAPKPSPSDNSPKEGGKVMSPAFAEMNKVSLELRKMEQATPPRGEPGSSARAVWEQHQRRIGDTQKKLWSLQDSVGHNNINRLGRVKVISNADRPSRPARPTF